jgi:hypothetical protein
VFCSANSQFEIPASIKYAATEAEDYSLAIPAKIPPVLKVVEAPKPVALPPAPTTPTVMTASERARLLEVAAF